ELEMADLGGDDRLRARRERGIADGDRLVVIEVPQLLLKREPVPEPVQGENEVRLPDHLLAVEVEVGEVKEQRVLLRLGVGEVPDLVARETLRLRMDAEGLVPRNHHRSGGVSPGRRLLEI